MENIRMTETTKNSQNYEELFAHRFTSEDQEYQQYVNRPVDPPPIVEEWRGRGGGNSRGRDNRFHDRRGYRGRGWEGGRDRAWGGDRSWRGEHHGHQHWQDRDRDRDRDRHWSHGSGHHSGPPNSNQEYSSHNQRPHYDRY
ncbi:hypothetical protein LDENG_00212570 [Lucifuga dentata]|nr:hypothetical protein LDENG_00212570 [Lucifuga dentata]